MDDVEVIDGEVKKERLVQKSRTHYSDVSFKLDTAILPHEQFDGFSLGDYDDVELTPLLSHTQAVPRFDSCWESYFSYNYELHSLYWR
jgi:hypothetical protein